jgi:hypothetical protein
MLGASFAFGYRKLGRSSEKREQRKIREERRKMGAEANEKQEKELGESWKGELEAKRAGEALSLGWKKYIDIFGEEPHGTPKQMAVVFIFSGLGSNAHT